jgi:hypothetical protein
MGGTCSTHGRNEKCQQMLIGKLEGKKDVGVNRRIIGV